MTQPPETTLFERLYARVSPQMRASLLTFRRAHPPRTLQVGDAVWEYLALGTGPRTVLFLHGMAGAYDIWWQQMTALQHTYRVISVTYPAVDTLAALAQGVWAVLDALGVERVSAVGSSLGGYLVQYLLHQAPERIERAVLGNTFPPNPWIARQTRRLGAVLPYLPAGLVKRAMASNMRKQVYPAAREGEGALVLAYGLEQLQARMTKAQVIARYRCVVEPFPAPDVAALGVPVLIVEADNDPLVEPRLRRLLRETYPTARVVTLSGVGHFPYLNVPQRYTQILQEFLS